MFNLIPISAAQWMPLSANYAYDDYLNFKVESPNFTDGYSGIIQPLYRNNRDVTFNRYTMFELTSSNSLFDILEDKNLGRTDLGSHVTLVIGDEEEGVIKGNVYTHGGYLYISRYVEPSLFRLIKNPDKTISLLYGSNYVTVKTTTPYYLYMDEPFVIKQYLQKFELQIDNESNEAVLLATVPTNDGLDTNQLFVSNRGSMLAAGGVPSDDPPLFIFTLSGENLHYDVNGLTRDQTWVKYYNTVYSNFDSKNVDIQDSVSGIEVNRIVDSAYLNNIEYGPSGGFIDINIANSKNIMTAEYEYAFLEEDIDEEN